MNLPFDQREMQRILIIFNWHPPRNNGESWVNVISRKRVPTIIDAWNAEFGVSK